MTRAPPEERVGRFAGGLRAAAERPDVFPAAGRAEDLLFVPFAEDVLFAEPCDPRLVLAEPRPLVVEPLAILLR
ncbi:hypothetical protein [Saccharomonospora sp.]|uniref:hypothetical protein n=1 Tax=Saccharomonospora sp. TaxID=33913 RepID=UPI00261A8790|nr:hypothetical protein [Saccharomonospora sp.]